MAIWSYRYWEKERLMERAKEDAVYYPQTQPDLMAEILQRHPYFQSRTLEEEASVLLVRALQAVSDRDTAAARNMFGGQAAGEIEACRTKDCYDHYGKVETKHTSLAAFYPNADGMDTLIVRVTLEYYHTLTSGEGHTVSLPGTQAHRAVYDVYCTAPAGMGTNTCPGCGKTIGASGFAYCPHCSASLPNPADTAWQMTRYKRVREAGLDVVDCRTM